MPGHFTHIYTERRVADWLGQQQTFNPNDTGERVAPLTGQHGGLSPVEASSLMTRWSHFAAIGAIGPDLFFFCQDYGSGPLAATAYEDDAIMLAMAIAYWVDADADDDHKPLIALLAEVNSTFADVVRFLLELDAIWKKFLAVWNETIGPLVSAADSVLDDLTGGLVSEAGVAIDGLVSAIKQVAVEELTGFRDIFSWFALKMRSGWDEQSFVWSDMLHYRHTSAMPANLFAEADRKFAADGNQDEYDQFRAFALGWVCHVGTDVVAHSFVNEQAGGPFRTHWQRHHLVENHIDAWNYRMAGDGGTLPADPDIAATNDYPDIGQSALHFAVAIDGDHPDGRPRPVGPTDASIDVDGEMPDWLADGIVRVLIATYDIPGEITPANLTGDAFYDSHLEQAMARAIAALDTADVTLSVPVADLLHQVAPRPNFSVPSGYPLPWEVKLSYRFMLTYYKKAFWGSFDLDKPRVPSVIIWPPASDFSNLASTPDFSGVSSGDPVEDVCDAIAAVLSWIEHEVEDIGTLVGDIIKALASPGSYLIRLGLYELAMKAWDISSTAHDILAHTGFVLPHGEQRYDDNGELRLANEIDNGLINLGQSLDGNFIQALADALDPLANLDGGVQGEAHNPRDPDYPFLPVRPTQTASSASSLDALFTPGPGDPSEYRRPWAYPNVSLDPAKNPYPTPQEISNVAAELTQAGIVGTEFDRWMRILGTNRGTVSGPYPAGATPDAVLFRTGKPVPVDQRTQYETASSPAITDALNVEFIGREPDTDHNPLGDPIPFSGYLMGRILSGDVPVDFNLDADRGFGYRAWDWIRDPGSTDANGTPVPPGTRKNGRGQPYILPVVAPEGAPVDDTVGANQVGAAWHGALPTADQQPVQLRYLKPTNGGQDK